jgi:hypothetical protein
VAKPEGFILWMVSFLSPEYLAAVNSQQQGCRAAVPTGKQTSCGILWLAGLPRKTLLSRKRMNTEKQHNDTDG